MPWQGLPGETGAPFYCETKGTGVTPITITPQPHHLSQGRWNLLLDADGALYLLVQREATFVSFERLVMLDEIELEDYSGAGVAVAPASGITPQPLHNPVRGSQHHRRAIAGGFGGNVPGLPMTCRAAHLAYSAETLSLGGA